LHSKSRNSLTRNDEGSRIGKIARIVYYRRRRLTRDDHPVMESIASELKTQRESRYISLAQIAADTNISLRHLESLEAGRFDDLPGGMYNRAILRAYCEILDLNKAEILERYESEVFPHFSKPVKTKVPITSSKKVPPIVIWSLMLLISATSIFLNRKLIFPVFSPYFSGSSGMQDNDILPKRPTPVPISPAPLSNFTAATANPMPLENGIPAPTQLPESQTAAETQTSNAPTTPSPVAPLPAHAFQLEVTGKETCWISVKRDGSSVFSGIIRPGEVQSFNADQKLLIVVGNAGGISLKINGKAAKPLGASGEVIKILIDEATLPALIDRSTG
jgi:cytoskeleton protein RodZ